MTLNIGMFCVQNIQSNVVIMQFIILCKFSLHFFASLKLARWLATFLSLICGDTCHVGILVLPREVSRMAGRYCSNICLQCLVVTLVRTTFIGDM